MNNPTENYLKILERLDFYKLLFIANSVRNKYKGNKIELCAIVNAKSGKCSEDCAFCAQSSKYKTSAPVYPLMDKTTILEKALEAKQYKVKRFSIVISGKKPSKKEIKDIAKTVEFLSRKEINTCASLGLLDYDEICYLRDHGLQRLHCNIETSENFFPKICTTHKFADKVRTLEAAKKAKISICSGGIFGMGESWEDRIDMAYFLKSLDVDSIPINFLTPIKGTPLAHINPLSPFEALKIIAMFRIILSKKDIRVCGGRPILKEFASWIFLAGANALMTGNYLTTKGFTYIDDLEFIKRHKLEIDF
ncbi:biotin synthase BioB [Thermodesulfobacterium thermophilum]|uniref:biotin synthase BioB n=1 Tax=Thermodesulfobacterium thermophilum TaxID=886 RepID=UPI0003B3A54B|nr:biotin synthase BioB [Thermodesulfobacterium thermophilum]